MARYGRAAAATRVAALAGVVLATTGAMARGEGNATTRPTVDLSKDKTLYVVGYAHLDTQWRWSYPQVIREFVRDTLRNNFPLIEKYPHYVFNFSGSRRYEMMREYYPEEYAKLKEYVAAGRWFPCGSSVDENDANVPSAESQIRHVLYGNHFFKKEFGVTSDEFMLPDCFGFPYALPSVLAHCGIKGFSTQKLTWGSAVGIPFKVGVWEGPDGKSVVAALDPGSYTGQVTENLANSESWLKRIEANGKNGVFTDYHYYGTGDRGGAPAEGSVAMVEKAASTTNGQIRVVSAHADWLFQTITPEQRDKLPRYKGELLLTEHSSGSITSEAHMKRWNRKNELLADAAEKASVGAMLLTSAPYPAQRLYNAWDLVLGSQMHDMLPGTSLPKAYEYCWNDELLALNQFAAVVTDAVGDLAGTLDTRGQGSTVVVYNPLSVDREDLVEADVPVQGEDVYVVGPDGKEVPAQIVGVNKDHTYRVAFLAKVPSVGLAVYDVRAGHESKADGQLKVSESSLENDRYRVTIDKNGDVASVFDKKNNRDVLSAPARLAFQYENPSQYPAWNMDWNDQKQPPAGYVDGPAKVRVIETGPARVAVEVTREARGSRFVQRIRLAKGSDHVEFDNTIDWRTKEHALKAVFPLANGNPKGTYDIQLGTVERENDNPKKYEFPHHQWLDVTAPDGSYGASVLSESKYGSDKPDDRTVRLTLIYTPGTRAGFQDQGTQDIGRHEFKYAFMGHAGNWVKGGTAWEAARFNQPLLAFNTAPHAGGGNKTLSLVSTDSSQVLVTAVKKAEDSDRVVVRLRNLTPQPAKGVHVKLAGHVAAAKLVDGQEREIGDAKINSDGAVAVDVGGYSLTAVAIEPMTMAEAKATPRPDAPVALDYDADVVSTAANRADGKFDDEGRTYPAELWPAKLDVDGVAFQFGKTADGEKNAVTAHGQDIPLPAGTTRVYFLAAAATDTQASCKLGDTATNLTIRSWTGYVGQWDNRQWKGDVPELTYEWHNPLAGLVPGYVKPGEVAWFGSHRHHPKNGDEPYQYVYIYKYALDVPKGAKSLTLPNDPNVKVFAISAATTAHDDVTAAAPLYDQLQGREVGAPTVEPSSGSFKDATLVSIVPPLYYVDGGLRYTTDGSDPTESSKSYDAPILLSAATTIKAAEFMNGKRGPITQARIDVNDVTPPRVTGVTAIGGATDLRVTFSEPLDPSSAGQPANYRLQPAVSDVASAALASDGRSVSLKLAKPLPPSADAAYSLTVSNVTDLSPNKNKVDGQGIHVALLAPVYRQDGTAKGPKTVEITDAKNLPVKASDPWTLNMWVRLARQPQNGTLIAGFGSDKDDEAHGRYFAKFGNGIHFWSSRRDVEGNTPFDLNKWQMITATYDGSVVRLYKDGQPIGQSPQKFADDEPAIRLFPLEPWDHKRRFNGEVKNLTIWPGALPPAAIEMLRQSDSKE